MFWIEKESGSLASKANRGTSEAFLCSGVQVPVPASSLSIFLYTVSPSLGEKLSRDGAWSLGEQVQQLSLHTTEGVPLEVKPFLGRCSRSGGSLHPCSVPVDPAPALPRPLALEEAQNRSQ